MKYFENGITILPENIKLLQLLAEDEIGEIMKAIFFHVAGTEPDEGQLSTEKLRLVYAILKNQIDVINEKTHHSRLFISRKEKAWTQ